MKEQTQPRLLTDPVELRAVCEQIASAGRFAFDTEFIMETGYETKVCLMQVTAGDDVVLVDPQAGLDTLPVWELVADPDIEVIVHAGMEDLALCFQFTGRVPRRVFDVQIAAGFVTGDYPLSLARLVRRLLRVRLHKSQTLTNWQQRPLSTEQLRYAVEDVAHLPAVRDVLIQKLEKTERVEWAKQEFARFEDQAVYEPSEETRVFKLKGSGSLAGEQLSVAAALLEARERLAQEYNRPARAVLRDHILVEIARHRWTDVEQIRSLRSVHLRQSSLRVLAEAVAKGLARPQEEWPAAPVNIEDTPEEHALLSLITAVLREYSRSSGVAFPLLASKQTIRSLIHAHTRNLPAKSPLSSGWRREATGEMIQGLLEGRLAVTVTGERSKTRLAVVSTQA